MYTCTLSLLILSCVYTTTTLSFAPPKTSTQRTTSASLSVVADFNVVANMERGVGGRIEDAFAASKEKGEAAFVTFVTAGYPASEGTS